MARRHRRCSTPDGSDTVNPTNCSNCQREVLELDLFPGNICLVCHAAKTAHLTDAELHAIITNTFNNNH
jgi:hypothetical protein